MEDPTKIVIDCETGEETEMPLTPDEIAQGEADAVAAMAQSAQRAHAFDADAERLAIIRERAETDPAYAALAELTLGTRGL